MSTTSEESKTPGATDTVEDPAQKREPKHWLLPTLAIVSLLGGAGLILWTMFNSEFWSRGNISLGIAHLALGVSYLALSLTAQLENDSSIRSIHFESDVKKELANIKKLLNGAKIQKCSCWRCRLGDKLKNHSKPKDHAPTTGSKANEKS